MAKNPNARPLATSPELNNEAIYPDAEKESMRVSRWTSILYLVVAFAAPVLVYSGPDLLSPSVPAIANAALDGRFGMHRPAKCAAKAAAADHRAPLGNVC